MRYRIKMIGFMVMVLLSFSIMGVFLSSSSYAAETGSNIPVETVDLSTISYDDLNMGISVMDTENTILHINNGNYERWIDRVDFPDYALDFYDTLVEFSDNNGVDDLLITDEGFAKETSIVVNYGDQYGKDVFHGIEYLTIENPTEAEMDYAFKTMRAAYDAFDMDHPEVFWTTGTSRVFIKRTYMNASDFTDTYYFLIKMHEGSYQDPFDVREIKYQSEAAVKAEIEVRDSAVEAILNTEAVKNAKNDYEAVKALNHWLTHNNEYNLDVLESGNNIRNDAHKCIGALTGGTGTMRPVCEGYSKAFKVLCDALNIPCVICTGNAFSSPEDTTPEAHSWNNVCIDGVWYAADVTWNDPATSNGSGPVTGYENETYLLVGKDTEIYGMKFDATHVTTNILSSNGLSFINSPLLSSNAYEHLEKPQKPEKTDGVFRIAGKTRYETSLAISDNLKETSGVNKFRTIIIASGKNFADALAGSYLASQSNAPILMTNGKNIKELQNYVSENLTDGGTIYLLGGEAAVSNSVEDALNGLGTIKRLAGKSRYETNLAILEEAGISDEDILVCTGKNFADSLSGSATQKPILLVNKTLSETQEDFLKEYASGKFYVIGGNGAVSVEIENNLKEYGETERISGKTRYETSVLIAQKFFENPTEVVLASAQKFPDGLCGGTLAISMNAPLILTAPEKEAAAVDYVLEHNISNGIILGGEAVITNESAKQIFRLDSNTEINRRER